MTITIQMTSQIINNSIIYLDNASTTALLPEVAIAMQLSMQENYGNPSSNHQLGRKAKGAIESSRRTIATLLGCEPRQIIFTSSATEANNLAIWSMYQNGVRDFITSKLEHQCILKPLEVLAKNEAVKVHYLQHDEVGNFDWEEIKQKVALDSKVGLCLLHGNNEISNLYPIEAWIKQIKSTNNSALFLSDMVQTIGHLTVELNEINVDFASASAHKFHGPKGIGFLYAKNPSALHPTFLGGGQERGYRSGTENVHAIVGLALALALAQKEMDNRQAKILELKQYLISEIKEKVKFFSFNGLSGTDKSLAHILSIQLEADKMISFKLDMQGIAISQGSACSSGASQVSSVIKELYKSKPNGQTLRVSLCHLNTKTEIDKLIAALVGIQNITKDM